MGCLIEDKPCCTYSIYIYIYVCVCIVMLVYQRLYGKSRCSQFRPGTWSCSCVTEKEGRSTKNKGGRFMRRTCCSLFSVFSRWTHVKSLAFQGGISGIHGFSESNHHNSMLLLVCCWFNCLTLINPYFDGDVPKYFPYLECPKYVLPWQFSKS